MFYSQLSKELSIHFLDAGSYSWIWFKTETWWNQINTSSMNEIIGGYIVINDSAYTTFEVKYFRFNSKYSVQDLVRAESIFYLIEIWTYDVSFVEAPPKIMISLPNLIDSWVALGFCNCPKMDHISSLNWAIMSSCPFPGPIPPPMKYAASSVDATEWLLIRLKIIIVFKKHS